MNTKIRKSPFKVDEVEKDSHAFGNRPNEVKSCIESIINDRHMLVSGARGIGKSSLSSQIQNFYKGDYTLGKRCNLSFKLGEYLPVYYTCAQDTTLSSLCLDLIFRIENKCIWIKNFKFGNKTSFEASLNLGIIKTGLKTDIIVNKPASVATQFVNGLNNIYKSLTTYTKYDGISILVDELDQLDEKINFGHFFKIIHEYLIQDGIPSVNFIFAGQKGIFTRLYKQDASVERVITHIPLSKLSEDECKHVLYYASTKIAKPPFSIEPKAEELILKISSGFPSLIHLIGNAAFFEASNPTILRENDVLSGLQRILKFDKHEKYYSFINELCPKERLIITIAAKHESQMLPIIIPFDWILSQSKDIIEKQEEVINIIRNLSKKGHIIINEEKNICQFNDELFRIFLALLYIESKEIEEKEAISVNITDANIKEIVSQLESSKYSRSWEYDREDI